MKRFIITLMFLLLAFSTTVNAGTLSTPDTVPRDEVLDGYYSKTVQGLIDGKSSYILVKFPTKYGGKYDYALYTTESNQQIMLSNGYVNRNTSIGGFTVSTAGSYFNVALYGTGDSVSIPSTLKVYYLCESDNPLARYDNVTSTSNKHIIPILSGVELGTITNSNKYIQKYVVANYYAGTFELNQGMLVRGGNFWSWGSNYVNQVQLTFSIIETEYPDYTDITSTENWGGTVNTTVHTWYSGSISIIDNAWDDFTSNPSLSTFGGLFVACYKAIIKAVEEIGNSMLGLGKSIANNIQNMIIYLFLPTDETIDQFNTSVEKLKSLFVCDLLTSANVFLGSEPFEDTTWTYGDYSITLPLSIFNYIHDYQWLISIILLTTLAPSIVNVIREL